MPAFRMDEIMKRYHDYGDDTFWVLWTKDPRNIIKHGMDFRRVALQLTVTGMGGSTVEPGVPGFNAVWDSVAQLIAAGFNSKLINWRFDPIVPGFNLPVSEQDIAASLMWRYFEHHANKAMELGIQRCIVSFVNLYPVVRTRWPECKISEITLERKREIVTRMKVILGDIELLGCVEPELRDIIRPSACIDGDYYSSVTGFTFSNNKDKYQRANCTCTESVDIGRYRVCPHNCLYCYSRESDKPKTAQLSMFSV